MELRGVRELVQAASAGERDAWDALVDRYSGLVVGVARGFRLGEADVADVFQTVWLRLVENLGSLREPEALPGWLATTTRNECLRTLRSRRRVQPMELHDSVVSSVPAGDEALDERLLQEERRDAVRSALAGLPAHCRELLSLLVTDPPVSYEEIGRALDMPHGSIGPTRSRCLVKLRRCPAVAALLGDIVVPGPKERTGHVVVGW